MEPLSNISFLVDKNELTSTKISEGLISNIRDGEVIICINKYAITSNNITYAVIGHQMKYWNFFPTTEPWGKVPVWGFGTVVKSNCEAVEVGTKYYGYFPMSTYLIVSPGKVNEAGFVDTAPHRKEMAPIYNYYTNLSRDLDQLDGLEDYLPIIKPLFTTSFLNYHMLKDESFKGADQVILTSASSKTALGIAYMLKINKDQDHKTIIGLTSHRNVEFVQGTGFYDQVISYEDIRDQLIKNKSIVIDLAGNGTLLNTLDEILRDQLLFISMIGLTDWKGRSAFRAHEKSKFFFAPSQAQKVYKEWGAQKANNMIAQELKEFIQVAEDWIDLSYIENHEDLAMLYHEMLVGHVNPQMGYIVSIE